MSSNNTNPAIGALILVPIIIAVSAAFIAIKASDYSRALTGFVCKSWHTHRPWSEIEQSQKRHRPKRLNSHSSQSYAKSWCDLEVKSSEHETKYDSFIGQGLNRGSIIEGKRGKPYDSRFKKWHPNPASHLAWTFVNFASQHPSHFESSNVARPSATALRPGRLSVEVEDSQAHQIRENGVRLWGLSGQ